MSSNAQVATLMAALQAVQSDVSSLQSRAADLQSQLEGLQSQQQAAPSSPQQDSIDLTDAINLASSIRDALEGTANTVQDHVDNAASANPTTGNAGGIGAEQPTSDVSPAPSSDASAPAPDTSSQEQTVIGDGGEAVTPDTGTQSDTQPGSGGSAQDSTPVATDDGTTPQE